MKKQKKAWLFRFWPVALVFVGLLSTVAAAPAPEQAPARSLHAADLRGTISAIAAPAFTLTTTGGDVTVQTDGETRFHIIGQEEVSLADFVVGDEIVVRGAFDADEELVARRVAAIPAGDRVAGRVTDVAAAGFSLETRADAMVQVSVTDDTLVAVPGQGTTTWSEHGAQLQPGMGVAAFGELSDDGSQLAAHIMIVQIRQRPQRPGVRGIMVTVNEADFDLQLPDETVINVATTAETNYFIPGTPDATLADFSAGTPVIVRGVRADDGTLTARLVAQRPPGPLRAGTIEDIAGATITLTTRGGDELLVVTDNDTIFRRGRELIEITDLVPGERIAVRGQFNGNSDTFAATHVLSWPAP